MKIRRIGSLVLNIIAVIASIVGLILMRNSGVVIYYKFFTIITNCLIILIGLVSIGYAVDSLTKKDKETTLPVFLFVLKLTTATSALVTFLTVVCYLQYTPGFIEASKHAWFAWNNICHHYIATLAFIAGFIFFDIDRKYPIKTFFFGPIVLAIYGAYIVPICLINNQIIGGAPYPFLNTEVFAAWLIPFLMLLFVVVSFALSLLLWVLNRVVYLIFIGEEVTEEEETEEEKELEGRINVTEEDKKEVEEAVNSGYKGPRIYHISKREDKMWQVKFANGKKAIRLFNTQAEAIVFAKQLAKSQEGSIRVHSLKGKIRKAR